MNTEAQLCNLALARVGQRQFINSLDEPSTQAQLCKALYSGARDALLAANPWPWARKHATLALLSNKRSGWQFAYQLPTDCLVAQYVFSGARPGAPVAPVPRMLADLYFPTVTPAYLAAINGQPPSVPFAIEASDDLAGRILLSDQEDAELIYTAKVEQVVAMPPLFVEALAWKLASDLALSLTVKPQLAQAAAAQADLALDRAIAASFREGQEDMVPDSALISVRG